MSAVQLLTIRNVTRDTVLCRQARLANTLLSGLRGLLGDTSLYPDGGLLLDPSSGVHTWGMRFPLDIVALDRKRRVIGLWRSVGRGRICGVSLRTRSVLELPIGQIVASGTEVGDQLNSMPFEPDPSGSPLERRHS